MKHMLQLNRLIQMIMVLIAVCVLTTTLLSSRVNAMEELSGIALSCFFLILARLAQAAGHDSDHNEKLLKGIKELYEQKNNTKEEK